MPSTELALAAQQTNETLAVLLAQCIHKPACMYHLSAVATPSRVNDWLNAARPQRARLPIWVWLSYPKQPPRYIQLNMRALERHAPSENFRIIILNGSTLGQWLPLPKEFHHLSHQVAASDVARLGLLATYGGLYVDADVLITSSLRPLLRLLDEYEVVTYTAPGQDCRAGVFSSNFLATRPNATLWSRAWRSLLSHLRQRCNARRRNKVCCCTCASIACSQLLSFLPHTSLPSRSCLLRV